MKRFLYLLAFVLLACVIVLAGCAQHQDEDSNGQDYFNGTILEIHDTYVLVECLEMTSGAVSVGTEAKVRTDVVAAKGAPEMTVGDDIRVVFTGVQEKDPVSFDTVFAIYLLDENGEVIFPE